MKYLVTAGPTQEAIDPVRYITNRSTGKMGFAIAEAAVAQGHEVVLVSGPVVLDTPSGVQRVDVSSAADMLAAVLAHFEACDVLMMAAAVADWRPRAVATTKLKKSGAPLSIELVPTQDVLLAVKPMKGNRLVVGFAAETGDVVPEARRKLATKALDLIVANDVSRTDAGFAVDTNLVTLISATDKTETWPLLSKREVAERLIERVAAMWRARTGTRD